MNLQYLEPLLKIAGANEKSCPRSYGQVVYLGSDEAAVTDGFGLLTVSLPELGKNETVNKNNLPSSVNYPDYKSVIAGFREATIELDASAVLESLKAIGGLQPRQPDRLPFYLGNQNGKLVIAQMRNFASGVAFNPWIIKSFMWPLQKLVGKTARVEALLSPDGEHLVLKQGPYSFYVLAVRAEAEVPA